MFQCFTLDTRDGISHIQFSRPGQMNSLTREFWSEFPQAIKEIESTGDTRVIVISSTGKHFSAGMDLSVFQANENLDTSTPLNRERLKQLVLFLQSGFNALGNARVPVIAAIQGACIGGALDLISACDLRYATKDATFKIQEINLGMMADLGALQRLPHALPDAILREMAFTGEALSASKAQALGFVNDLFDSYDELLENVLAVAKKVSVLSPLAVSASKEALNFARDHSLADSLLQCANLQAAIFNEQDLMETMRAKKEKTPPDFSNLHAQPFSL